MTDQARLPARRPTHFGDDTLRELTDWESLGQFVRTNGIAVNNLSDYGPGFIVLDDKRKLIDVPLMVLDYRFNMGDNGEFVSLMVLTKNPVAVDGQSVSKMIVNDGSTGILNQIRSIETERAAAGEEAIQPLYCPNGLRSSTYDRKDKDGEPIINDRTGQVERATTFYLN